MLELCFEELNGQAEIMKEEIQTLTTQGQLKQQELMQCHVSLEEMTCETGRLYQQLEEMNNQRDTGPGLFAELQKVLLSKDKEMDMLKQSLEQASARLANMNESHEELSKQLGVADDTSAQNQSQADFLEETLNATSKQLLAKDSALEMLRCGRQDDCLL